MHNIKRVGLSRFFNLLEGRFLLFIKYLRITPFRIDTERGRSKEKLRLLSWAVLTSGLSKISSLAVMLCSIHWASGYLGPERFGIWMTITSIIAVLSFFDLGMGNSVVNLISELSGKTDSKRIHQAISTTFFTLLGISICLGIIFSVGLSIINLADLFNIVELKAMVEVKPAISIYLSIFLISLPLSIVHRVQVGLQESWRSNSYILLGQLLAIFFLAVAVHFRAGVPYLILAIAGGPLGASAVNFFIYFNFKRKNLYPKLRVIDWVTFNDVTNAGLMFLVLQFLAVIGSASDNLVIAKILGLDAVSTFSIVQKLALILGISQLLIAPMWPIFGEALGRNDYEWAQKTLKKMLWVTTMLGVVSGLVILIFGGSILKFWVGYFVETSFSLMLGFAFYSVLMNVGGCLSVYLNNTLYLKKQLYIYAIASLISLALKILLVWHWHNASGAIWGTIIGYGIFFIFPAVIIAFSKR